MQEAEALAWAAERARLTVLPGWVQNGHIETRSGVVGDTRETTAIAAREHGLKVSVAASACATADPRKEETALRYLVDVVGVALDDTIRIRGFTADDSGYLLATNEQGSGE